jgi:malonyl-CoA O-methyltransferase
MSVQQIVRGFARSAAHYDAHAHVQLQCADRLDAYTEANTRDLIDGSILEVGCGTGIVSHRLAKLFHNRPLELTDVCEEMLGRCRMRLAPDAPISFNVVDVQNFRGQQEYALIVAAFVLQWVENLPPVLGNLMQALKPGGKLFFSVPTSGSFPEWRAICKQAGVTFTGNSLPSLMDFRSFAAANNMRLSVYEETFPLHHASMSEFLKSLKSIGAGTSLSSARLSITETKRLLAAANTLYPHSFTATYKVLFGHLSKP